MFSCYFSGGGNAAERVYGGSVYYSAFNVLRIPSVIDWVHHRRERRKRQAKNLCGCTGNYLIHDDFDWSMDRKA